MEQPKKDFIMWLATRDPMLLRLARKRQAIKIQQAKMAATPTLGAAELQTGVVQPNFWNTLVETARDVLPTVVSMPLQKKILDVQIKRAEQGMPPLDAAQYVAPIKVQAEISPESEKALTRIAQDSTKTGIGEIASRLAPYAIPAAILAVLLGRRKK